MARSKIVASIALALILAGACQSSSKASAHAPIEPTTSGASVGAQGAPPTIAARSGALVPLTIAAPSHAGTYNRATDFGGWKDVDGCKNTRAELLVRTTRAAVTYTRPSECTVKTGRWTDPWSGTTTTAAAAFQIDHTVPLANAWRSGAWAWTRAQRVAYANDLGDRDHLVPILGPENEAKGDSGPDEWKPPNRGAWCRYALDQSEMAPDRDPRGMERPRGNGRDVLRTGVSHPPVGHSIPVA